MRLEVMRKAPLIGKTILLNRTPSYHNNSCHTRLIESSYLFHIYFINVANLIILRIHIINYLYK